VRWPSSFARSAKGSCEAIAEVSFDHPLPGDNDRIKLTMLG